MHSLDCVIFCEPPLGVGQELYWKKQKPWQAWISSSLYVLEIEGALRIDMRRNCASSSNNVVCVGLCLASSNICSFLTCCGFHHSRATGSAPRSYRIHFLGPRL
ncbi:hypothetical protein M758_5G120200 [Ceratodon purpureus]|nr:hypothetical protein M758_5G120200 [Ceratodon purpureus]